MITGTQIDESYTGNGVTTSFSIPFSFLNNTQIKVSWVDGATETESILTEGVEYDLTGGNPATHVLFLTAPDSDKVITVYRETALQQTYDYLDTGAFPAEAHEAALDKIVMMIQEVSAAAAAGGSGGGSGSGAFERLTNQSLAAAGIITIGTSQRSIKRLQGSGAAVTADTTTPLEVGTIDGQEMRLVGSHDDNTVTITAASLNVLLNGDVTLTKYSVLDLCWDETDALWIETGRNI